MAYTQPRPKLSADPMQARLLQEHMQLKNTPVMSAYLDGNGCIISQNSHSFGCLGCHGTDLHLPGWKDERGETLYRYLDHLFMGDKVQLPLARFFCRLRFAVQWVLAGGLAGRIARCRTLPHVSRTNGPRNTACRGLIPS